MSEQIPIRKAELARHWGVRPSYVSNLIKRKALPEFTSFEEADAWRAVNAPPKAAHAAGSALPTVPDSANSDDTLEKNAAINKTTTSSGKENGRPQGELIDVTAFIRRDVDFDALMIESAEGVPQVAHGLYLRACAGGSPNEIAAALKNWNDAMKAAAAARLAFLETQEKTRALLPLDVVMDIVGTELQALRANLLKLGERIAARANPDNPALARGVIDAAVDESVFRQCDAVESRASRELAAS